MYANVWIVHHKSTDDLAEATRREQGLTPDLAGRHGFGHASHIRIGALDALHVTVFDSEEDSRADRFSSPKSDSRGNVERSS